MAYRSVYVRCHDQGYDEANKVPFSYDARILFAITTGRAQSDEFDRLSIPAEITHAAMSEFPNSVNIGVEINPLVVIDEKALQRCLDQIETAIRKQLNIPVVNVDTFYPGANGAKTPPMQELTTHPRPEGADETATVLRFPTAA